MKILGILSLLVVAILAFVALVPGAVSSDTLYTGAQKANALGTSSPDRPRYYKSYPAPTGQAGFRKYYQKRCYPGCHYGSSVASPAALADTHNVPEAKVAEGQPARPRYYKSYPAPTGQAGFRKYYQKRCYPGCHYGGAVVAPGPNIVHP